MNRSVLTTLLLATTLIFISSCRRDPCRDVPCQQGECEDGTCVCDPGWSGAQCEVQDPCYGIDCQNGGACMDGTCDCPEGWTGPDCSQVSQLISISVTGLQIVNFPALDNGVTWDVSVLGNDERPDIYFYLEGPIGGWVYTSSTKSNADPGVSWSYDDATLVFEPDFWSNNWTLYLNDYDGTSNDDFMGQVTVTPYPNAGIEPATLTFNNGSDIEVALTLQYNYD